MRRYHQRQLLELAKTLYEAHDEMKCLLAQKDIDAFTNLLASCQECAVEIGRFIEQLMGEGTRTVALLETYCEFLYQASNSDDGAKAIRILRKQLTDIENSIQTDLKPDKLEIVFLPYKASMFDSMESVWLAAKNDPQCDAYVIPVPSFDKLPDGTLGQMHFDGMLYPNHVPVVDWRTYDIGARHPDIIVTHYAYDDNVSNATIHPQFYSKRLREHCELLVHVPYFVVSEGGIKEYNASLPGIVYANRVIVESDFARKDYIKYYKRLDKKLDWNGCFGNANEKFVALGSPKFDKILNARPEDYDLPAEWKRLTSKPDGTRKKIILYNTHMFAWIVNGADYFKKLRCVFDFFRNQEDAVLWWRPHPNTELNFRIKRPEWLGEYKQLVLDYIQDGFGVYDDSPDLHRAIAVSDAYYGDWSSLDTMYQCTGKPIMIQNLKVLDNDLWNYLCFENFYEYDGYFWCAAQNFNSLLRIDKQSLQTEWLGTFPDEDSDQATLYARITHIGGKLYFTPFNAKEIGVYDIKTNSFEKIPFKDSDSDAFDGGFKFYTPIPYKNWIFFIPIRYPAILRYDTQSGKLDYFSDWVKPLEARIASFEGYLSKGVCVDGSKLIIPSRSTNVVLVFDMKSCDFEIVTVGDKRCSYTDICFDGKNYWLLQKKTGSVVKWNPTTGDCKKLCDYPEGFEDAKRAFVSIVYANGFVWLLPLTANMALQINVQDESIHIADAFQPEQNLQNPDAEPAREYYRLSLASDNMLYAHTIGSNRFIQYNVITGEKYETSIALPVQAKNICRNVSNQHIEKNASDCKHGYDCYFSESIVTPLDAFIYYINHQMESDKGRALRDKQMEIHRQAYKNSDGTAGSEIYFYCKREVMT